MLHHQVVQINKSHKIDGCTATIKCYTDVYSYDHRPLSL